MLRGFVGVLMIARPWSSAVASVDMRGVAYMVVGSLSIGCSFVYARRFLSPLDMSPVALSTWQIGFALVTISCVTPFHGLTQILADTRAAVGIVFGLGMLGTGVAYILYYFIVQRLARWRRPA